MLEVASRTFRMLPQVRALRCCCFFLGDMLVCVCLWQALALCTQLSLPGGAFAHLRSGVSISASLEQSTYNVRVTMK